MVLALLPLGLCLCASGQSAKSSQCHDHAGARAIAACCCNALSATAIPGIAGRGPEDAPPQLLVDLGAALSHSPSWAFVASPSIRPPAHSPPALTTPLRIWFPRDRLLAGLRAW